MKEIISMTATLILAPMILIGTGGAQSSDEKYVIGTTSKTVGYMPPWVGNIKNFFQWLTR